MSAAVGFLVSTLLFAAVLYGLGHHHPKCLGGVDFYEAYYFTDAFVLSWATFRLSPPERRYADVLGLSDWPRYPDSRIAEPNGNKLHDLR